MKIRKPILLLIIFVFFVTLTGCAKKSKLEQTIEDMAKTKITVDQETVQQVQEGIDSTKGK